jgi:hypothetical protein
MDDNGCIRPKLLRELLRTRRYLIREIIDGSKNIPHSSIHVYHFGSMARADELIDYRPGGSSAAARNHPIPRTS